MDLPNTETRVMESTAQRLNIQIRRRLEAAIFYYAQHSDLIEERLNELDKEWDIERTLETNAAGVSMLGVMMAAHSRKWLILPLAVAGFLMQHALQGWCPPIEIFRRFGVRTTKEINLERLGLKALRGDFNALDFSNTPDPCQKAEKVLQLLK